MLSKYETTEKIFSHTSMTGKKYLVKDEQLDDFYNIYLKYKRCSIIERHIDDCSQITIDMDIQQTKRIGQINDNILDEIYNEFKNNLTNIFYNPDLTCYMLLRPKPYLDKKSKNYKDGIHIYFPYIVTSFDFQYKLREQMMPILGNVLKNIENINTIENTYDKAVIQANGMFLYGSTKPGISPYEIYKIYENDRKSPIETLGILSLRNKKELTQYINVDIENQYKIIKPDVIYIKPANKSANENNENKTSNISTGDESLDRLEYLVMLLPESYYNEYKKWFDIAAILYNSNNNSFDIFNKFSQQSDKYNEDEIIKLWEKIKMKTYNLTIGSLIYYLKQENIKFEPENKNKQENMSTNYVKYGEKEFEEILNLLPKDNSQMKCDMCAYINTNNKKLKNTLKKWYNNDIQFNEDWKKYSSKIMIENCIKKFIIENNKLEEYKDIHNNHLNKRMEDEQKINLNNCIMDHRDFLDKKSKLEINKIQNIGDRSIVAYLNDTYCPIKKCDHDDAHTRMVFMNGTMEMYHECGKCNDYFPQNLIKIDPKHINIFNFIISNNITNNTTINNNYKSSSNNISKKDENILIETDKGGADIILKKIKNNVIKSNKRYFIRENENIYVEDYSSFYDDTKNYILKEISNMNLCKFQENIKQIRPYSKNTSGAMNILKMVMINLDEDKEFVKKLWHSNLGKLCFKNGYYDFTETRFKPYDSETFSTIYIKRDFPERNNEKIKEVYDKILDPIFWDKEQQAYFLNWCVKGLAGFPEHNKTFGCSIGNRNSGKGVLFEIFKGACGDYVGSFNPEEMICCRVGCGDIAKKMAWCIPFEFRRLNFSNELKTTDDKGRKLKLDGNIIKSISSGGDEKTARMNYKNEIQFKIQGRMMMMMNEMIGITPHDATQTMVLFRFQSEFKEEITNEEEEINKMGQYKFLKADMNIKSKINKDIGLSNAFIHILLDHYSIESYKLPKSMRDDKMDMNDNEDSIEAKLKNIFEFTNNVDDVIAITKVNDETRSIGILKSSLKTALPRLGVIEKPVNNVRCYAKIKMRQHI